MPKPYQKSRKSQPQAWRKRLILFGGLVVLVFCVGLVVGYFKNRDLAATPPVAVEAPSQGGREVILYFASADGTHLVAETRQIDECQLDEDCLHDTVEALIAGPQGGFAPILPAQAALLGVTVADSLVRVDFSQELITAHPGGTQSELLTVYGLADTLAVNFPHLRQVQILVDGAPAATLKGHVDLRQPVNPDFSLVEEGLAPTGKMISLPVGGDE
ncbi:MAG: GerMN domain-containing protein [Desulfuromonadales bacterium]|jgi:spore germination protein GerM|nr:GerMN domain-containing protein [Desulfuromonadales bacterium]